MKIRINYENAINFKEKKNASFVMENGRVVWKNVEKLNSTSLSREQFETSLLLEKFIILNRNLLIFTIIVVFHIVENVGNCVHGMIYTCRQFCAVCFAKGTI